MVSAEPQGAQALTETDLRLELDPPSVTSRIFLFVLVFAAVSSLLIVTVQACTDGCGTFNDTVNDKYAQLHFLPIRIRCTFISILMLCIFSPSLVPESVLTEFLLSH